MLLVADWMHYGLAGVWDLFRTSSCLGGTDTYAYFSHGEELRQLLWITQN